MRSSFGLANIAICLTVSWLEDAAMQSRETDAIW